MQRALIFYFNGKVRIVVYCFFSEIIISVSIKKSFFVPYFEIKKGSDKPTKQDYPLPDLKKVKII
ncbi:hypothetical protein DCO46_01605 [Flavobacterium sp. HTF]|nr:hypothetical protein DCO46_01605 [Flavobacterium sp. HTF]